MAVPVPTVALYGAINALLNVALAVNVTRTRAKTKVGIGTGDSAEMMRAVRAHANSAEYVPLAVLFLLIAELWGGGSMLLHVFGGTLTVARLASAIGILGEKTPIRAIGATLTWLVIAGLAIYILTLRY